jgi:hypothetical protein
MCFWIFIGEVNRPYTSSCADVQNAVNLFAFWKRAKIEFAAEGQGVQVVL